MSATTHGHLRRIALAATVLALLIGADVASGASGSTERVSVGAGDTPSEPTSFAPAMSADGRYVAFVSRASNLVAGDPDDVFGSEDVFVFDRFIRATRRVSRGAGGAQADGISSDPSISADGRFVALRLGRREPGRGRHERAQ